jgi:hypothetical protein
MRCFAVSICAAAAALLLSSSARAIVIESGAANNSPPTAADGGDPGFYNVGMSGASCVYIGNGWVLSANHVGEESTAYFQGVPYSILPGSYHHALDGADIELFRLDPQNPFPNLPTLQIAPTQPVQFERTIMIGAGQSFGSSTQAGVYQTGGPVVRWGENIISAANIYGFSTLFSQGGDQLPNEAQAALGDSGGAAFVNGRLAGIITEGNGTLNGFSPFNSITSGMVALSGLRPDIIQITGTGRLGDTNGDGIVDQTDLNNVLAGMNRHYGVVPDDVDGDLRVTMHDLWVVFSRFGLQVPQGAFADLFGDFNHNGVVDGADVFNVFQHLGDVEQELLGDTNGDGVVDQQDYNNVINNWSSSIAPVPEPASLIVMTLGGLAVITLARRTHRRHHQRPLASGTIAARAGG